MSEVKLCENVFKSKWGYHPCEYSTFLKLKKLNMLYNKALKKQAAWKRWERKEPQNRIRRKKLRNEAGQVMGLEALGPKEEPTICSLFNKKGTCRVHFNRKGQYFRDGIDEIFVSVLHGTVQDDYVNSRYPKKDERDVLPLRTPLEEINNLFDKAKELLD